MSTVRAFAVPAAAVMVLSSMLVKGAQRLRAVFSQIDRSYPIDWL
jgi:hypothetical protein